MKLLITVEDKSYEVEVQILDDAPAPGGGSGGSTAPSAAATPRPAASAAPKASAPAASPAAGVASGGGGVLKAPIVGTVVKVLVTPGTKVAKNQPVIVMEAMKMETNVAAHDAGTVKSVKVAPGQAVKAGDILIEFE